MECVQNSPFHLHERGLNLRLDTAKLTLKNGIKCRKTEVSRSRFFQNHGRIFSWGQNGWTTWKSPSLQISPDPRALLDVCGSTLVDLCYIFAFLLRVRGWEKDLEGNLRCPKGGDACTITWITNFRVKHAEGALTPVLCFLSYAGLLHGRNWCRIVITRGTWKSLLIYRPSTLTMLEHCLFAIIDSIIQP